MSSYNSVTKIKYTGDPAEIVKLDEYIVFRDDRTKRKYIVFKFVNNVTQQLLGMQFEVCQYDIDGNLIEKSQVVYNKFLAGAEEEFVPKAKLRVSYKCESISVKLIHAAFDRFVWKEGEYEDNSYKFDRFYHDEQHIGDEDGEEGEGLSDKKSKPKKARKEKQEKLPKEHKQKKKKSRHPFILRDATKRNSAGFPVVFNVIIFLSVIAFVGVSMFFFKRDTKKFTYEDYQLRIISEDRATVSVSLYGYTGSQTELVIPEKLGGYTVIKIDTGAFVNSRIESVTINCDLTIEEGAFVNCKNLTALSSQSVLWLAEGAFRGCTEMTRVNLTSASHYNGAFIDCGRVTNG